MCCALFLILQGTSELQPSGKQSDRSSRVLQGASIVESIKKAGVKTVVALPDIVTCDSILWPIARDADLRLVPVCKEDEGVSICAALSYCEERAVLLIQHLGFLDSINAIRVIALEYKLPVVMILGLQGMEADRTPAQSDKLSIQIVEPICQAMGLEYQILFDESDVKSIETEINKAYEDSNPFAFLIARRPE
jgi:sulfopyruvate decarboxylase TPP-binding subunit